MCEGLQAFSAPTRAWFTRAFGQPTAVQREAWPAIHAGQDVLAIAPTGSGKTLAAFLAAIDRLMSMPVASRSTRGVRVLYVSPLKALAVDVAKNLMMPLNGIAAAYQAQGDVAPAITVATRSGDTTAKERRHIATHPPQILVTTPESLYLMLTSKARSVLRTVDTVILDEVHAVAGSKRGAHLALSLERLDALIGHHAQRIGLSATVRPVDQAARFIAGDRPVTIVNPAGRPAMDIHVVEPLADMRDLSSTQVYGRAGGVDREAADRPISGVTPAMRRLARRKGSTAGTDYQTITGAAGDGMDGMGSAPEGNVGSIWPVVERSVLDAVLAHHTTLVFVNSRGLAEKLTARINDLYAGQPTGTGTESPGSPEGREGFARHYDAVVGSSTMLVHAHGDHDVIAMAHHGSVSKDRRTRIEHDLKTGRLRCVVATSSLELGIDMGAVDLVIQIAPPLSVSSGLQRIGRADHRVGGISHAQLYPLTRGQIIGAAASVEAMRAGDIEPLTIPRNPLDILAQQTVAAASLKDLDADTWYAEVRHAAPFTTLTREDFDATMGMLTGAYASEAFSAFRPPLMRNEETGAIAARPGAQRLAVTSGGTIPDRGLYTVVLPEADAGSGPRRIGELDEEMVYESRVGDVITLGTSTWTIQEITRDRVIVTPAPGRTARLPFWHGDGVGRDAGFGRILGQTVRDINAGLIPAAESSAQPAFTNDITRRLTADGLDTNAISNLASFLAEQRAATGVVPCDRQLVLEQCPDEEGDQRYILHSPWGRRVHEPWALLLDHRLKQQYGCDGQTYAADDGIVFRLPGTIRMTSDQLNELLLIDPDDVMREIEPLVGETVLFAARFRECAARSLFMPRTEPGRRVPLWQQRLRAAQLLNAARTQRNFPLLLETARECLQDVYDLPALRSLMAGLASGTVTLHHVITDTPSPMAEQLLFGYVGQVMYQYDVPQAERSTQLLSVDPQVLERLLGTTDMAAVLDPDVIDEVAQELGRRTFWNALEPGDITGRVTRYAKTHGPFTADQAMQQLGLDAAATVRTLDELTARGVLLHGHFTDALPRDQWLHPEVFRRIRSRSLARARAAITPVDPACCQRFILERQGVCPVQEPPAGVANGEDALLRVIEQLEGVALPAETWERRVFPARVRDYTPAMLDSLFSSGDVLWVGAGAAQPGESGLIAFHPADSLLLPLQPEPDTSEPGTSDNLPAMLLDVLADGGAYRSDQLATMVRRQWAESAAAVDSETGEIRPCPWSDRQCEDALWNLVWHGCVTNTGFAPVRALQQPVVRQRRPRTARPMRSMRRRLAAPATASAAMHGLWMAVIRHDSETVPADAVPDVQPDTPPDIQPEAQLETTLLAWIDVLLDRYGVIARPLLAHEQVPGGFAALYPVLARMEEHGTVVRGMFVRGLGGVQFATKATVNALRRMNRTADDGPDRHAAVALDMTDPANCAGAVVPWPDLPGGAVKPARRADSLVVLVDGQPILYASARARHITVFAPAPGHGHASDHTRDHVPRRAGTAGTTVADMDALLQRAMEALVQQLHRDYACSVSCTEVNGQPATMRNPYAGLLRQAGFTPTPQGMTLYPQP